MTDSPTKPVPGAMVLAVLAGFVVALSSSNTMPLLVGALIDGLALGAEAAGLLGSLELGAIALSTIALAPRMTSLSWRGLALSGGALAALAHAGCALLADPLSIALLRCVAGLGEGAALAAANTAVAAAPDPDRLYARVVLIGAPGAALLLATMPFAIRAGSYAGAYAALGALTVAALPFVRRLPDAHRGPRSRGAGLNRSAAAAILFAVFALQVCQGAIWAFSERLGLRVGLTTETVGWVLGGGGVLGMSGAGLATLLGTSRGRGLQLLIGIATVGSACVLVVHAPSAIAWAGAQWLWSTAFLFTLPFLLGAAAAVDPSGRVSAAVGGVGLVGTALGPILGGTLLGWGSPFALSTLAVACCAASAGAVALALARS